LEQNLPAHAEEDAQALETIRRRAYGTKAGDVSGSQYWNCGIQTLEKAFDTVFDDWVR
jgi:hypothetical protein